MDGQMAASFHTCFPSAFLRPSDHSRLRSGTPATYTWEVGSERRRSAIELSKSLRKMSTGVISATLGRQASLAPSSTVTNCGLWAMAERIWPGNSAIRAPVLA
ncbi:hypothetical protein GCM10020000_56450 [Streptomyces olivoverticillatus]